MENRSGVWEEIYSNEIDRTRRRCHRLVSLLFRFKWNIFRLKFLYILQYWASNLKGLNLYFNSIQSILNFFNYYSMALISRKKDRSERRLWSIRFRVCSDTVYSQFERCSCLGCSSDVGQLPSRCSWELPVVSGGEKSAHPSCQRQHQLHCIVHVGCMWSLNYNALVK